MRVAFRSMQVSASAEVECIGVQVSDESGAAIGVVTGHRIEAGWLVIECDVQEVPALAPGELFSC